MAKFKHSLLRLKGTHLQTVFQISSPYRTRPSLMGISKVALLSLNPLSPYEQ